MSETTTFPFDSTPGAQVVEDRPDRRRLLLLVALGVLLVAVLGYFVATAVLGGSDNSPIVNSAPVPHRVGAAASPAPAKVVPKTFNDIVGHDPFDPLVTAPVVAAVTTRTTAPSAPSAATAATTPATTPGMTTFKVLSVSASTATVSVDTKKYTVSTGHVFASTYKLLKTSGGTCASFAYGEMRFSLCEGQTFIF